MPTENSDQGWIVVVGAIGIVCLLLGSLGYALRDSGAFFEAEQINQFVLEQQSETPEVSR